MAARERTEGGGGIHPIILTRKKVAGNKMDCGERERERERRERE